LSAKRSIGLQSIGGSRLIIKEIQKTLKSEYRIMNVEYRMSKEGILSFLIKRLSVAKPPFEILRFNIQYSAVRFFVQV